MFRSNASSQAFRRGVSTVQVVLVVAAITIVALVGMRTMMQSTTSDLNQTAAGLADPSKLAERFE